MSSFTYVIGLDIGTTSTKAVAFDQNGTVLAEADQPYPITQPKADWAEQNPHDIFSAVLATIGQVVHLLKPRIGEPQAVGISSAMHSLLAADENGKLLTQVIIWADNRASHQANLLHSTHIGLDIYKRTGTPIHPMSPLTKLMWIREYMPALFKQTAKWISIKEYILFQLFGKWIVDRPIASATGLYSLQKRSWDDQTLQFLGLSSEKLSTIVSETHTAVGLSQIHADSMGISRNTAFVVGGSDGALANIGVGATQSRTLAVTIGTSGAVRALTNTAIVDQLQRTFCYEADETRFIIGGATNNGGLLLRWVAETMLSGTAHDLGTLMETASRISAGAEGLIMLPYITGERAPIWNPSARGVIFGLDLHHQQGHIVRAAMESVVYSIHHVSQAVQQLTGAATSIRASGGFVKSALWTQILADVTGTPVLVPSSHQSSALGAAGVAMKAIGEIRNVDEVSKNVPIVREHEPNPNNTQIYREGFEKYLRLYERLRDEF